MCLNLGPQHKPTEVNLVHLPTRSYLTYIYIYIYAKICNILYNFAVSAVLLKNIAFYITPVRHTSVRCARIYMITLHDLIFLSNIINFVNSEALLLRSPYRASPSIHLHHFM